MHKYMCLYIHNMYIHASNVCVCLSVSLIFVLKIPELKIIKNSPFPLCFDKRISHTPQPSVSIIKEYVELVFIYLQTKFFVAVKETNSFVGSGFMQSFPIVLWGQ